ncbi:MAG: hypothetical protein CL846_01005 [Crocinitomicaceae bacterium]|nr:hypothetical protein [Crocinitomicaceae bacterium]|tara:strand:+ start:7767 stop:10055 length:2289 start_codon:yes stop_codon:yes gene_type:complete
MSEFGTVSKRRIKSKPIVRFYYFFPFQLFLLHLKRNHILLFFWVLLTLYVTGNLGASYGVDSLFLAPTYMGEISFISFIIIGFSFGGFIMAFHIYTYILFAHEFKFLATLSRPFLKFCINNMIIPLVFLIIYIYQIQSFLRAEELMSYTPITGFILSLFLGLIIFYIISIFYFVKFNKNVYAISGKTENYYDDLGKSSLKQSNFIKKQKNAKNYLDKRTWHVETYLSGFFSISLARSTKHYEKQLLEKVFSQNHINASFFELALLVSFLVLGFFREKEWLNIPAGASIFLLFTLLIMVFSIFYSWFKGWTLTILIVLIFGFNYMSTHFHWFEFRNYAYGLNYSNPVDYNLDKIKEISFDQENLQKANNAAINSLENWKKKNNVVGGLPKLILVNTSGGGLRAALWTVHLLHHLDSVTNNKFFNHTHLITGASGGMIGATFYREMKLKQIEDKQFKINGNDLKDSMGKDLLNPLAFSIATTDMFMRFKKFQDVHFQYTKDRGWFFENQLVSNLNAFHNKRLKDYHSVEYNSIIPTIIFSPSVVNDGRRLLISSQPISFLTYEDSINNLNHKSSFEDVEFNQLFANNSPQNLKITSAIRMNATFPYILPMVVMPTSPKIEVMDAGIRDNYGLSTSIKYLSKFKYWIKNNTSGVIVVQIRDKQKSDKIKDKQSGSLISKLFTPLTNVYSNFLNIQDYNHDNLIESIEDWYDGSIQMINFNIEQVENEEISMSWHLTSKDKSKIYEQLNNEENLKSIEKIKFQLLN